MRLPVLLLAAALAMSAHPALAALQCTANDTDASILASPDPDDTHPDWDGDNKIGLAWTLAVKRTVKNASGVFYQGDLISPRGGVVTKGVFVVKEEWTCE